MFNLVFKIIIVLATISSVAFAKDCKDLKAVAQEAMMLELSGRFYVSKTKCMSALETANPFKYILARHDDFDGENDRSPRIEVQRKSANVLSVDPKPEYPGSYIVKFTVKGKKKDVSGAKFENFNSQFEIMTYTSSDADKYGCSGVVEDPVEDFLFQDCF